MFLGKLRALDKRRVSVFATRARVERSRTSTENDDWGLPLSKVDAFLILALSKGYKLVATAEQTSSGYLYDRERSRGYAQKG